MSLAECTALLFQAVSENSVSLLEFAKRTYSKHQLLASLIAQCNEAGETPLVIAIRGRNDCVIDELVKVLRICDRTIEENQLKLSIAIHQLSHQIQIVELIGYLTSDLRFNFLEIVCAASMWLNFIAQVFKESTSFSQKDKIIALELIGAMFMYAPVTSLVLFGLECWKVAMTLRSCPQDGQPLLPKIPDVSVSSEASSLVYGSAIEVMSLEELDILQENFENGVEQFSRQCYERIIFQALLVLRRISTQANLEYPHWLYLKNLFRLTDFYVRFNYKLTINVHLLLMEQLNGFDPKLLPRRAFDVFTKTISSLMEIFFIILKEIPHPDGPARNELNYKNLLAPTEFISTISKFFSNPAMISSVQFRNCGSYSFAEIVFRFLVVLDEISPEMSNHEKQKLEEYYSNFIRNFFPRRTFNVLHAALDGYVNEYFNICKLLTSSPSSITYLILKLGADPNDVDEFGQSPLLFLAGERHLLFDEDAVPVFRALVDADTHLDTAADDGETFISILKENLLSIKQSGEIAHPYFESLANTVFPLKCYCARVIRRHGIPFDKDRLPIHLQGFVAMHSAETSPAFQ